MYVTSTKYEITPSINWNEPQLLYVTSTKIQNKIDPKRRMWHRRSSELHVRRTSWVTSTKIKCTNTYVTSATCERNTKYWLKYWLKWTQNVTCIGVWPYKINVNFSTRRVTTLCETSPDYSVASSGSSDWSPDKELPPPTHRPSMCTI